MKSGLLFVANESEGENHGCIVLTVGVLFLGAALYGVYGDGSLKSGSLLAYGLFGGSLLAIVIGFGARSSEVSRAKEWSGFALHPEGVSRASARRAGLNQVEDVALSPAPSSSDGEPAVVILLTQSPDAEGLAITLVAYCVGDKPALSIRGRSGRFGRLPKGKLRPLRSSIRSGADLRSLAEALREARPEMPVTLIVAPEEVQRKRSRGIYDPVADIRDHLASREEQKRREALTAMLSGDLGASLSDLCEEYGWTLKATG